MIYNKAANKEANDRNKRGELKVTQPRNGMTGGASTGIARAEANEKSTERKQNQGANTGQGLATKKHFGHVAIPCVNDAHLGKLIDGGGTDIDSGGGAQKLVC